MGDDGSRGLDDLERGRRAFEDRRWADAFKALTLADEASPLAAPDLASLAWSAYLTARYDDFARAMERAHRSYLAVDETQAAARCAVWTSFVLFTRGDFGPASGWAQRAARLIEHVEGGCAEQGYLLVPELMMHAMRDEWEPALARAMDAAALGERFADVDLVTFARHWQGRALVRLRRVREGFALLDEAMVSVVNAELSPMITGVVYCSMIEACQEVYDLRRSQEWTRALAAWCDGQPDLVPFVGQCLVHRAELLVLHGEWEEALNQVALASAVALQAGEAPIAGSAEYVCGEIHRLRGEYDQATEAFERAHRLGRDPQPGMALMQLARGEIAGAVAAIRRACDERVEPVDRAAILPAFVEVMLSAGELSEAKRACEELAGTASAFTSSALGAVASWLSASVALTENSATVALRSLREAEVVWQQLGASYELARTRMTLARAHAELGDDEGMRLNAGAAREVFAALMAKPDLARLDVINSAAPDTSQLSPRELDVLRLITTGKTNKAIAAELAVSEKTVERHVSNIFTKLGVTSRAAATAYAYEHRLAI